MRFVFDCAYLLAAALISPMVLYRMISRNRYRIGWANRFGKITRKDPQKKCIWLHAVSVGEVNATRTIIEQLQAQFPAIEIAVSTTTDTGFDRANSLYGRRHCVFYFPLDFSFTMKRAFREINPAICLLMELEVWPNFTDIAYKSNIPIVVVNGRISDKSSSRYRIIKPIAKGIFKKISLILAQTDQYARRFKQIGCPENRVLVTGSLKYDTAQITDKVDGSDALASELNLSSERLWVAGATGNNEEKLILDVYQNLKQQRQFADLRLAIVPRKPERFDEVAQLIEQSGLPLIRYSRIKNNTPADVDKQAVILGDTMGDLRKFYSLAAVIFVGRSLVPIGGSDMIEAVALGKCTIFGPHTFNFNQTVDALLAEKGAILVENEKELLDILRKCLTEPEFAQSTARAGQQVIKKNQGATQKTIDQIKNLL